METITLGGLRMPKLGLGTWPMRDAGCREAVAGALALGYRHVDTAENYGNEAAVGEGIRDSGVARGEVHLTTKVSWEHLEADAMRRACEESLARLGVEYVDLYLIHWPAAGMDMGQVLETLVRLQEEGRARAIGVSNFTVALMREAVDVVGAPIACNQVEYHVMLDQTSVLDYARSRGIAVTAYSPMAKNAVADEAAMQAVARKHGVSPAQVALKWLLDQEGVAAIPKAASAANQAANLAAWGIVLDDADRAAIAGLAKDRRLVDPARSPAWDAPVVGGRA